MASSEPKCHTDSLPPFAKLVQPFANKIGKDVIIYVGDIADEADANFAGLVKEKKQQEDVFFLLGTAGGSADSAYRMARCLSRNYRSVTLCVDSICKSAGTLISLAANEIVMTDLAELGPLDVQLAKPDELAEWASGLTPIQALSTLRQQTFQSFEEYFLKILRNSGYRVTTKTAFELSAKLVIGLFQPVFGHLDPMKLGEIQRAMLIAHQYGARIASPNVREQTIARLISEYPSHGFIIDRTEACELFEVVREPTDDEGRLIAMASGLLAQWNNLEEIYFDFLSNYPDKTRAQKSGDSRNDYEKNSTPVEEVQREGDRKPARTGKQKSARHRRPRSTKEASVNGEATAGES